MSGEGRPVLFDDHRDAFLGARDRVLHLYLLRTVLEPVRSSLKEMRSADRDDTASKPEGDRRGGRVLRSRAASRLHDVLARKHLDRRFTVRQ